MKEKKETKPEFQGKGKSFSSIIERELIPVQHFYNKCTTALSHGMGPTVCETHLM
jgi:hypothetical protein